MLKIRFSLVSQFNVLATKARHQRSIRLHAELQLCFKPSVCSSEMHERTVYRLFSALICLTASHLWLQFTCSLILITGMWWLMRYRVIINLISHTKIHKKKCVFFRNINLWGVLNVNRRTADPWSSNQRKKQKKKKVMSVRSRGWRNRRAVRVCQKNYFKQTHLVDAAAALYWDSQCCHFSNCVSSWKSIPAISITGFTKTTQRMTIYKSINI